MKNTETSNFPKSLQTMKDHDNNIYWRKGNYYSLKQEEYNYREKNYYGITFLHNYRSKQIWKVSCLKNNSLIEKKCNFLNNDF